MSLAAILLFGIFCTSSALPTAAARHQTAPQPAPASKPPDAAETQDQGAVSPAQTPSGTSQPPSAAPAKSSPGQNPPRTTKRPRHKRRVSASNCNSTPAGTASAANDPATSGKTSADPASGGSAPASVPSAPKNCPPSKVIVRHGGTAEPSIQLAGGAAGNQTSHERDSANQMLGSTEANLKKIAGRQLSPNQQDMVNQIRQFMEQSKTAVVDGDLERARTLAWKAELLSEELLKPGK